MNSTIPRLEQLIGQTEKALNAILNRLLGRRHRTPMGDAGPDRAQRRIGRP